MYSLTNHLQILSKIKIMKKSHHFFCECDILKNVTRYSTDHLYFCRGNMFDSTTVNIPTILIFFCCW